MSRFDSQDAHAPIPNPNAYTRIEFPCMLHAPDGRKKIVNTKQQKEDMLKKGWLLAPKVQNQEEELDPIDMQPASGAKK